MAKMKNVDRIELFLTLLFAISVFLWKPGMYVSSGLITFYLLARSAIDHDYRKMVWSSQIAKVSLAMFLLGILTSSIGAENFSDVSWMARKTLFLPVIVFFVFALTHERNRMAAITGLIASFWIACVLSLHKYGWTLSFGGRMEGTWPQGTWDTLLGLFFTFMVLSFKWMPRSVLKLAIYGLTTLMALLMLILAGGRAPWLGSILSLTIFFVFFNRDKRVVWAILISGALIAMLTTTVLEERTKPVIDRLSSVVNTTTDGSNWIRLKLWEIGTAQLVQLAKDDPLELIFGGGAESYNPKQAEFFKTMPFDEADRARLKANGYPSGDSHNTYIDNALRHGVLWAIAMLLYLVWLCTRFSTKAIQSNPTSLILLTNLLIVGMFYTVVPHFVTLFFVLFIACLGIYKSEKSPDSL